MHRGRRLLALLEGGVPDAPAGCSQDAQMEPASQTPGAGCDTGEALMALDFEDLNHVAQVDTEPDQSIIDRLRFDDALDIPHQLADLDVWLNYCNDDLYHLDKAIRAYIKKTRWSRQKKGRLTTAVPLVFMQIFGRKPGPHDSHVCMMMHRILQYYCTSYTGTSKIAGVRFTRVYHFSKYAMRSKRPMSLRLRLEESKDGGDHVFREYKPRADKRGRARRGATAYGPFADGTSGQKD